MLEVVRTLVDRRLALKPINPLLLALLMIVACGGPSTGSPTASPDVAPSRPSAEPAPSVEAPPEPALPVAPDIRVGVLDNGLTYYIKQHRKPEQRAAHRQDGGVEQQQQPDP